MSMDVLNILAGIIIGLAFSLLFISYQSGLSMNEVIQVFKRRFF